MILDRSPLRPKTDLHGADKHRITSRAVKSAEILWLKAEKVLKTQGPAASAAGRGIMVAPCMPGGTLQGVIHLTRI